MDSFLVSQRAFFSVCGHISFWHRICNYLSIFQHGCTYKSMHRFDLFVQLGSKFTEWMSKMVHKTNTLALFTMDSPEKQLYYGCPLFVQCKEHSMKLFHFSMETASITSQKPHQQIELSTKQTNACTWHFTNEMFILENCWAEILFWHLIKWPYLIKISHHMRFKCWMHFCENWIF